MAWRTQTTTLSSVGFSGSIQLDPTAKTTVVQVSATASSSYDVYVQVTLDDPVLTATPVWTALSTTHFSSTVFVDGTGVFLTVLSPIAGLRLGSSTIASASTITLKALQSVTA